MTKNDQEFFKGLISDVKSEISELRVDISELRTDVSELKTDVSELKADVSKLKADVSELKVDVKTNTEAIHRNGLMIEGLQDMFRLNAENTTSLYRRVGQLEEVVGIE